MSRVDEFRNLRPTKGNWVKHAGDDCHIWDPDSKIVLAGYLNSSSDADFILFAYANMGALIDAIESCYRSIKGLESENVNLKEVKHRFQDQLDARDKRIELLTDLLNTLSDESADIFAQTTAIQKAKEIVNESRTKGKE